MATTRLFAPRPYDSIDFGVATVAPILSTGTDVDNTKVAAVQAAAVAGGYGTLATSAGGTAPAPFAAPLRDRGPWQANTVYSYGDVVTQAGSVYVAPSSFTSGSSFVAGNWTKLGLYDATDPSLATTYVASADGATFSWNGSQITLGGASRATVAPGSSLFSRAKWYSGNSGTNAYIDGTNLYCVTQRQHRVLADCADPAFVFANKAGYEIAANSLTSSDAPNTIFVSCSVFVGCKPGGITGRTLAQTIAVGDTAIKLNSVAGIGEGAIVRVNFATITEFRVIRVDAVNNLLYTDTANASVNFTLANNPTITIVPTVYKVRFSRVPTTSNNGIEAIIPVNGIVVSDPLGLAMRQSAGYDTPPTVLYTRTVVRVANSGERFPAGHACTGALNEGIVSKTSAFVITATGGAMTSGTKIVTGLSSTTGVTSGMLAQVPGAGHSGATLTATVASVDSSSQVTLNVAQNTAGGNAENTVSGQTVTFGDYLTDNGLYPITATDGSNGYHPVMILAQPRKSSLATVGLLGDSRMKGDAGNNNESWGETFCQTNGFGCVNMARGGETAGLDLADPAAVQVRGALLATATTVIDDIGVNDISNGAMTAQTEYLLKLNRTRVWFRHYRAGQRVFATTQTPRTTSTDSWATATNQTVTASNAGRLDHNAWIRAGAPIDPTTLLPVAVGTGGALVAGAAGHPLFGYIDVCSVVEVDATNTLTQDGGFWKAGYTGDGLHPNGTAHLAIAVVPDATKVV